MMGFLKPLPAKKQRDLGLPWKLVPNYTVKLKPIAVKLKKLAKRQHSDKDAIVDFACEPHAAASSCAVCGPRRVCYWGTCTHAYEGVHVVRVCMFV